MESVNLKNTSLEFIIVPFFVIDAEDITSTEKLLFSLFHGLSITGKSVFVGNAYLCAVLKVDDRQIRNLLKSLEDKGYIERAKHSKTGRRIINVLKFGNSTITTDDEDEPPETGGGNPLPGGRQSITGGAGNPLPPYIKAYSKEKVVVVEAEETTRLEPISDNKKTTTDCLFDLVEKDEEMNKVFIAKNMHLTRTIKDEVLRCIEKRAVYSKGTSIADFRKWLTEAHFEQPKTSTHSKAYNQISSTVKDYDPNPQKSWHEKLLHLEQDLEHWDKLYQSSLDSPNPQLSITNLIILTKCKQKLAEHMKLAPA